MNVEIGAEAVLFPEKEYINGVFSLQCIIQLKIMRPVLDWRRLYIL
jgi:hypothetical protein